MPRGQQAIRGSRRGTLSEALVAVMQAGRRRAAITPIAPLSTSSWWTVPEAEFAAAFAREVPRMTMTTTNYRTKDQD